jgi:DUF4097 and DUF4098 domain-containing protein YvlB
VLAGGEVAVYNLAGIMRVEPGSGRDVVVEVSRGGKDGERLQIRTGPLQGRSTLRVIYPASRVVYRKPGFGASSTLRVAADGTFDRRGWGGRRVTVASWGRGLEAHADVRVLVPAGKRIEVHLAIGEASVSNVKGEIRVDTHAAPVRAEGTRGPLSIDVGSGSVSVTDAEGGLAIDTGSGGCRLSSVRGSRVSVDTGSGGVTARDVRAQTLDVDTGSGGVELAGVRARSIRVDTGSGHVALGLESDVDALSIDTGSGGVTVSVPDELGAEIDVETGSGGIHVDFPFEVTLHSRDHLRGRVGDGHGTITIETGSGGVRLRRS